MKKSFHRRPNYSPYSFYNKLVKPGKVETIPSFEKAATREFIESCVMLDSIPTMFFYEDRDGNLKAADDMTNIIVHCIIKLFKENSEYENIEINRFDRIRLNIVSTINDKEEFHKAIGYFRYGFK